MRVVWIAIIAVCAIPLAYVAWLANPLFVIVAGVEPWLERMERLYPYRWRILFLIVVCVFSVTVYAAAYG